MLSVVEIPIFTFWHMFKISHFPLMYYSTGISIFSCLDAEGESSQVLMPDEALGITNWTCLLFSLLIVSLFTGLAFAGRGVKYRRMGNRGSYHTSIWDSCFFYFSHLVLNPIEGPKLLYLSWRFILAGWLLGVGFFLNRVYLCNMKGELATVKIIYTDTIKDLLSRSEIENIYMDMFTKNRIRRQILSLELRKLASIGKIPKKSSDTSVINTQSVLFIEKNSLLKAIRDYEHKPCRCIYKGKMEYERLFWFLTFSRKLPPWFLETVDLRIMRYLETKQRRPFELIDELPYHPYLNNHDFGVALKKTTLNFLVPIWKVWMCGILLSIAAIAIEVTYHLNILKYKGQQKNKQINFSRRFN